MNCNCFVSFCVLSLDAPNFKIFMIKFVLFFLSLPVPLVSYPRNHCQIQCCEAFAWCSSPSFIVSVLTFKSLIHFEFMFVCGIRVQLHVHSCPVFPGPLVKKTVLSTRFDYCSFVAGFEIRKCESSSFIVFLNSFGYLGSFEIPQILR